MATLNNTKTVAATHVLLVRTSAAAKLSLLASGSKKQMEAEMKADYSLYLAEVKKHKALEPLKPAKLYSLVPIPTGKTDKEVLATVNKVAAKVPADKTLADVVVL